MLGVQEGWSKKKGPLPPTKSVLFVDNTIGGVLYKRLQESEDGSGSMSGYRVRVAEAAGTPLSVLLPSTNPWGPMDCQRDDCVTCKQDDERRIDCRRRNILYESECMVCAASKPVQKDGKVDMKDGKGVYVGESSRSIYERAKEHDADKEKNSEESHQIKHWLSSHEELLAPPKFKFKLVKSFKDPLTRQLSEAVRIELRGSEILNSKSEYSRCRVPRLTVDMEGWKSKKEKDGIFVKDGNLTEQEMVLELIRAEAEDSLAEVDQPKRKQDNPKAGRKAKRRKLDLLVGWGEANDTLEEPSTAEMYAEPKDWI
jgi:hypothetical protein